MALSITAALAVILTTLRTFPPGTSTFYPTCPIHRYLGILCPGCGSTRALAALLHGQLQAAWSYNGFTVLLLPFAAVCLTSSLRRLWLRRPPPTNPLPAPAVALLLFLAAAFTVLRNLPA